MKGSQVPAEMLRGRVAPSSGTAEHQQLVTAEDGERRSLILLLLYVG